MLFDFEIILQGEGEMRGYALLLICIMTSALLMAKIGECAVLQDRLDFLNRETFERGTALLSGQVSVTYTTAKTTEAGETYIIFEKYPDIEIRTGIKVSEKKQVSFLIEIIITICNTHQTIDISMIEKQLQFLKIIKRQGYTISCEDNCIIVCEKTVDEDKVTKELHQIKQNIKEEIRGHKQ